MVLLAVGDRKANSRGWVRTNCPFCVLVRGDEDTRFSFGVSATTGRYECYKCATKGKLPKSMRLDSGTPYRDRVEAPPPPERPETIDPPEGFMLLGTGDGLTAYSTREARQYLERRSCPLELTRTLSAGVCLDGKFRHRVVFPIIREGEWVGWVARSYRPSRMKYLYPPGMNRATLLFNEAALAVETDEPLLVVEGIFDCLPHWPHVAACLGKPTDPQLDKLATARRPLVMLLDGDAWIESRACAWHLQHEGRRASWLRLPPRSDPAELDPGVTRELARAVIEEGDACY
jgi:hypothetical protein